MVALAGGVGAARFLDGLTRVLAPERIFIIGNTADDAEIHGLHISPDLDTVTYTLAGLATRSAAGASAATASDAWRRLAGSARTHGSNSAIGIWQRIYTARTSAARRDAYRDNRGDNGGAGSTLSDRSHVERSRANTHLHARGRA